MARNPGKTSCKSDGCRNYAMRGGEYCRSHAPALPPPNVEGAAAGNNNSKTHGLYSDFFREEDLAALAAVAAETGLEDEIALTRVAIRRLAQRIEAAGDSTEATTLASALFVGTGRVAGLLKAQKSLSGEAADGIAGAIGLALDELSNEWGFRL